MHTRGVDHLAIVSDDMPAAMDFYTRVMGLQIADENLDRGIVFLSANPAEEHHEFVLARGRDVPKGAKVVQQISFKVGSPQDIREYHERLQAESARIERFEPLEFEFGPGVGRIVLKRRLWIELFLRGSAIRLVSFRCCGGFGRLGDAQCQARQDGLRQYGRRHTRRGV
jgi:catechol 2,3-dioxygenase-like lactoylglutathione lyase family enzyme